MIGKPQLAATVAVMLCIGAVAATTQVDNTWTWSLPAHVPVPRVPADNPMSPAKVELGRHLFYDKRLSGNGTQACASCHQQDKAFTDARAVSVGSTGEKTHRSALSLVNSAWNTTYNWANPALVTLEQQMAVPLFGDDPVEMGITDGNRDEVLARLRKEPRYQPLFAQAFAGQADPITMANIIQAIAAFQRSIVSVNSRYDQYLLGKIELTKQEQRGQTLFFGEQAECHHCHGSFNFNDQVVHARSRVVETLFHNTGVYNLDGKGSYPHPNRGLFEATSRPEDMGAFRAPSLRNIAVTAPYQHDGSLATLREVLNQYAAGGRITDSGHHKGDGRANPLKSEFITRINLNQQDIADLEAFLHTLTDQTLLNDPKYSDPWHKPPPARPASNKKS